MQFGGSSSNVKRDLKSGVMEFVQWMFPVENGAMWVEKAGGTEEFQQFSDEHQDWLDAWGIPNVRAMAIDPTGWLVYVVEITDREEMVLSVGTATERVGLLEKLLQDESFWCHDMDLLADDARMAFEEMELVLIRINNRVGGQLDLLEHPGLLQDLFDSMVYKWGEWNGEGVFLPEAREDDMLDRENRNDLKRLKEKMKEKIKYANRTAYMLILEKMKLNCKMPAD